MTALLSLLAAKATPYIIGGGAILAVWLLTVIKAVLWGRSTERNAQKAKEADSLEKHLEDIGNANIARNSVDSRVPDHDPYRRD